MKYILSHVRSSKYLVHGTLDTFLSHSIHLWTWNRAAMRFVSESWCRIAACQPAFSLVRSKTSNCKLEGVLNVEGPCVFIVQTLVWEALNFSPPWAKDVTTTSSMLFPSCSDSPNNKNTMRKGHPIAEIEPIQFHLADVPWPLVDPRRTPAQMSKW